MEIAQFYLEEAGIEVDPGVGRTGGSGEICTCRSRMLMI